MGLGQFSATVVSELFIRMSAASCEKYGQNIVNRLYLLVFIKILKFHKLRILTSNLHEKRKCKKMLSGTDRGKSL